MIVMVFGILDDGIQRSSQASHVMIFPPKKVTIYSFLIFFQNTKIDRNCNPVLRPTRIKCMFDVPINQCPPGKEPLVKIYSPFRRVPIDTLSKHKLKFLTNFTQLHFTHPK